MKFYKLQTIADCIAAKNMPAALSAIDAALEGETGPHWRRDLTKLADVIRDNAPRFTIFKKDGNSKLPFLAFSALPGAGFCPGAGECLTFCYSFRAWRYPAAFARQAQNSILMQTRAGRDAIITALTRAAPAGIPRDFRLYVDGDFGDAGEVLWWMEVLRRRPHLRAYGYSKSWSELLKADTMLTSAGGRGWPQNYALNLSSGSHHDAATEAQVAALPITRGRFVAVSMGRKVRSSDHNDRGHQRELRETYGAKAFTCPGKCGECTPKGHACGSARFAGIDVIIAVH